MRSAVTAVVFFLVLVAAWQWLVAIGVLSHVLLPTPLEVVQYYLTAVRDGTMWDAVSVTLRRLAVGYLAGAALGVPLGFINARFRLCHDSFGLLALGLQALPSICWAPLALLWFGQTEWAMFFIVVMGTVWSVALATESAVRNLPPIYLRAARTMGSRRLHLWVNVIAPASLPFIIGGMKQGWAFAWRSLMAAEIYITILSGFGLGHLLHYGRELHAMDQVFGIIIVIVAIGLLADKILFGPVERFLHHRWGTNR
ncbi:MAG TPA: ABC transporter permease [Verrucomicrobiae bacterium]|nr:ABC transporter permease [Verrucomicrobiae bacterium]